MSEKREPDAYLLRDADGYVLGAYRSRGEAVSDRDMEPNPEKHEIVPLYTKEVDSE